jgi:hypothetical protein
LSCKRIRRSATLGGSALGALGAVAATLFMSSTAGAETPVPADVWIQCSGFSGPSTAWPHPLTGCVARGQKPGTGFTQRSAPGTETIFWDAPFLDGASFQLTNIASQVVGPARDVRLLIPLK